MECFDLFMFLLSTCRRLLCLCCFRCNSGYAFDFGVNEVTVFCAKQNVWKVDNLPARFALLDRNNISDINSISCVKDCDDGFVTVGQWCILVRSNGSFGANSLNLAKTFSINSLVNNSAIVSSTLTFPNSFVALSVKNKLLQLTVKTFQLILNEENQAIFFG